MATETRSNSDLARAVFDAFNARDFAAFREVWADDVTERFPDSTTTGVPELEAALGEIFAALPDGRMEIQALAEDGDTVFVRWVLSGTHTGAFQGIEPTGRTITLDGVDHLVFRDGRQRSNFVIFDRQQFGQQLGLMPPDGSAAERGLKAAFNAGTALKARLARRRG